VPRARSIEARGSGVGRLGERDLVPVRLGDIRLADAVSSTARLIRARRAHGTRVDHVASGCVGEGVVEGVERIVAIDLELEAVVRSLVEDADGDLARGLVPKLL
jgi:hypothetical protein